MDKVDENQAEEQINQTKPDLEVFQVSAKPAWIALLIGVIALPGLFLLGWKFGKEMDIQNVQILPAILCLFSGVPAIILGFQAKKKGAKLTTAILGILLSVLGAAGGIGIAFMFALFKGLEGMH